MHTQKMSEQWLVWKTTLTSTTIFLLLNVIMLYGLKHPFCEFKSGFPVVIPLNPHPTHYRVSGKKEKALMLCKPCSAIAKALVWYQHCFSHKYKTQQCMKKVNLVPARPSTSILFGLLRWELWWRGEHFGAEYIAGFCRNKLKFVEKR